MVLLDDEKEVAVSAIPDDSSNGLIKDGTLEFTRECGGNGSTPYYQEASGAPVEGNSPLGYEVGWFTTIFLNIGQMIGTGVFSTPGTILAELGSPGLSFMFWLIGFLIAAAQLAVYLELASFFPARSGAEVVYLEQAYPRPKYLLPMSFAVVSVLLSFSSSNAIVLSEYLYEIGAHSPTAWQEKGLAVAGMTVIALLAIFHTRFSLWLQNAIGVVKVITLIFISIVGFVVLGRHTSIADPTANFRNSFAGTTGNGNGIANALVKVNFAYSGYTNAFNVNPIRTLTRTAPVSLLVVAILYVCANIAYFAAVPKEQILTSTQRAASLFFTAVFGSGQASRALNALIALSAFGNILAGFIGNARVIRECGRQGVLPWPKFWSSTRPFATPLGPYVFQWGLTILMILAPPAGDAFNFLVDLESYPANVFFFATTFGLLILRRRRARLDIPRTEFRAWTSAIIFSLAVNIFILVMPWYPPAGGRNGGDVSFWYGTYCVTGLGILLVCVIYYIVWIYILPRYGQYQIRQEIVILDAEGANTHRLLKIPNKELEAWDRSHDVRGNLVSGSDLGDATGKPRHVTGLEY